jgi:NTP pyrophosphatase (non-canonical NTP hydrolase)
MNIEKASYHHYEWLKEMGWTGKLTPLEQLALIASEIGEAANECRGETPTDKLGSELADIVLRVFGMSEELNINIEQEILDKMKSNRRVGNRGRTK